MSTLVLSTAVVVNYHGVETFSCELTTLSDTELTCTLNNFEEVPGGSYGFTVTVGGQVSELGSDSLNVPVHPIIHSVSGCGESFETEDGDTGTQNCPTAGNVELTLQGYFLVDAVVSYTLFLPHYIKSVVSLFFALCVCEDHFCGRRGVPPRS